MSVKTLLILAVATALLTLGGLALDSGRAEAAAWERTNEPLFEGLEGRLEQVDRLVIRSQEGTTTLERDGEEWTVSERGGYPARLDEIGRVLKALALAERVEPKTKQPEHYPELGLGGLEESRLRARGRVAFQGVPEDGASLTLSPEQGPSVTFEFTTDETVAEGHVAVDVSGASTAREAAAALRSRLQERAGGEDSGPDVEISGDGALVELTARRSGPTGRAEIEGSADFPAEIEDLEIEDTETVRVTAEAEGQVLADLFIGKRRPHGAGEGWYVREPDEERAWAVKGKLRVPGGTGDWLESEALSIARDRIVQVHVEHADGGRVELAREDTTRNGFEIQNLPEGREPKSEYTASAMAGALHRLRIQDVAREGQVELEGEPSTVTTFWTKNGLKIACELWVTPPEKEGGQETVRCRFTPSIDESRAPQPSQGPSPDEPEGAPAEPDPRAGLEEEVADLTATTEGWIYTLPSWKKSSFVTEMEDLLKEAEDDETEEEETEQTDPEQEGEGGAAGESGAEESGEQESGEQESGEEGSGEEGSGEQGSGEQGSGEQGSGEQGSGEGNG